MKAMKPTLLIVLLCMGASGANIPKTGLLFYYQFNNSTVTGVTARDQSGNGLNLTSSAPIQLGDSNSCLSMNGTYYLSIGLPDSTIHAMTDSDFTFGFTFNTTTSSGSMSDRMDMAGTGDPYNTGVFLSFTNDRVRIFLGNHGYYDTPDSLDDGKWHSAIAVRYQGVVNLYIDGISVDNGAVLGSLYPGTDTFTVGKHGIKNESYFIGLLNNVFYYTVGFSAGDVANLYKDFTSAPIVFIPPFDTFLVAQPKFAWHSLTNAIAYAFEVSRDSLFTNPFVSVPLDDTTLTVPTALSAGRYFMHVGYNSDDRSPFFFSDSYPIVIMQANPPALLKSR